MSTLEVSASRYSLTVDTTEAFASLSYAAENDTGARLRDALAMALQATVAYATAADRMITTEDVRPEAGDSPDLPCMNGPTPWDVLKTLESAGFVTVRTELVETSDETYLSEGRRVTMVHVDKPFTVVTVDYEFSREANRRAVQHGHTYADRWTVTGRSDPVPEGWYLLGEIAEYTRTDALACVIGMNEPSDDVVAWLSELEGFGVTTCLAGCASCARQWRAESGEWTFHPDGCDAEPWAYNDADDFRDNTIACPACRAGRVGFTVC